MIDRKVTLASRTPKFNTLVVWKFAFTMNAGVSDMVTWTVVTAGTTFDLVVRYGRIYEVIIATPWL